MRVRARMVFVVDEYGVVQGLMTPHDLLEAITGELQPGAQAEAWATQREDGSWLLDGLMPVAELKARLYIRELPEEDRGRYNTVAGPVDVGVGPPARGGRAHRLRRLAFRGGGPGRQAHRQGAGRAATGDRTQRVRPTRAAA